MKIENYKMNARLQTTLFINEHGAMNAVSYVNGKNTKNNINYDVYTSFDQMTDALTKTKREKERFEDYAISRVKAENAKHIAGEPDYVIVSVNGIFVSFFAEAGVAVMSFKESQRAWKSFSAAINTDVKTNKWGTNFGYYTASFCHNGSGKAVIVKEKSAAEKIESFMIANNISVADLAAYVASKGIAVQTADVVELEQLEQFEQSVENVMPISTMPEFDVVEDMEPEIEVETYVNGDMALTTNGWKINDRWAFEVAANQERTEKAVNTLANVVANAFPEFDSARVIASVENAFIKDSSSDVFKFKEYSFPAVRISFEEIKMAMNDDIEYSDAMDIIRGSVAKVARQANIIRDGGKIKEVESSYGADAFESGIAA